MSERSVCGKVLVVVLAAAVVCAVPAMADVKLPAVIGSNMVLQQGAKLPVWGKADPGEQVTVTLCGNKAVAKADAAGAWKVVLPALKAGGPFEMMVAGKNTLKLTNVLVGEVWVCSGQSNMAMSVRGSWNSKEEIAKADYPKIRLLNVGRKTSDKPLDDIKGSWAECSAKSVGHFSAAGYFFGRKLHKELNVPIGLINSSWGGTPAEAWTSRPTLEATPESKPILERWDKIVANYPAAMEKFKATKLPKLKEALKKANEALKAAQALPASPTKGQAVAKARRNVWMTRRRMRGPTGPNNPHRPASLYNGMIAPLVPFAIKGAIWYQGESNASRAYQYRAVFSQMIQDWRKQWQQPDQAFYWVQLANFRGVIKQPAGSDWAELREAQSMALALPNTGEAVIIDIGEARDIHPKNKQDVGRRLALSALGVTYGRKICYSGPVYASHAVEGATVRVEFKHQCGGLVVKPFTDPVTPDGPSLEKRFGVDVKGMRPESQVIGFQIAGADKKFVWAEAKIDGSSIVVSSPKVAAPVAVRYAWEVNPICNLYNKAGLPASPFRTDKWTGVTVDRK